MKFKLSKRATILLIIGIIIVVILSIVEGIINEQINSRVVREDEETIPTVQQAFGNNFYTIYNWADVFKYYQESEMNDAYRIKDEVTECIENNFEEKKWQIQDVLLDSNYDIVFKIESMNEHKIIKVKINSDQSISMIYDGSELIGQKLEDQEEN